VSGPRLIPAEQSVACAINRAAGGRPIPGNRVDLLIDGPETYKAMLEVIANATRWVHFENYIIRSDSAGWRFAEVLARRAREGIPVRVLYDWFGSVGTARGFWRYLRSAGVEVRPFHRPQLVDVVTNISRNHRKLVVADGNRAILGGLCIGCEWTGENHSGGQPWRDTAVDIHGPASAVLDQTFVNLWEMTGGDVPHYRCLPGRPTSPLPGPPRLGSGRGRCSAAGAGLERRPPGSEPLPNRIPRPVAQRRANL
jgi:cardiolipin synthase